VFGATSLCAAALIVPPSEGVLAGVMLVVFRALVRHVSEYAPFGPGRKTGRLYLVLIGLDLELQSVKLTR
jgi:hypothetical protein